MPADVAEVGVAVVADEVLLADRAEQRAVRRERVDAGVVQRREHLLGRVEQRLRRARGRGCRRCARSGWTCRCPAGGRRRRRPRSARSRCRAAVSSSYSDVAGDVLDDASRVVTVEEALEHRRATDAQPPSPVVSRSSQNDQIRRPSKSTSTTSSSPRLEVTPASSTAVTRVPELIGSALDERVGPRQVLVEVDLDDVELRDVERPRPAGRPSRSRARCRARSSPGRRPRRGGAISVALSSAEM